MIDHDGDDNDTDRVVVIIRATHPPSSFVHSFSVISLRLYLSLVSSSLSISISNAVRYWRYEFVDSLFLFLSSLLIFNP